MFNQNLLHWYLGKKYVHTMYIFLKLKKLSANFIGEIFAKRLILCIFAPLC